MKDSFLYPFLYISYVPRWIKKHILTHLKETIPSEVLVKIPLCSDISFIWIIYKKKIVWDGQSTLHLMSSLECFFRHIEDTLIKKRLSEIGGHMVRRIIQLASSDWSDEDLLRVHKACTEFTLFKNYFNGNAHVIQFSVSLINHGKYLSSHKEYCQLVRTICQRGLIDSVHIDNASAQLFFLWLIHKEAQTLSHSAIEKIIHSGVKEMVISAIQRPEYRPSYEFLREKCSDPHITKEEKEAWIQKLQSYLSDITKDNEEYTHMCL